MGQDYSTQLNKTDATMANTVTDEIVFLLHGIRTRAVWQDDIMPVLSAPGRTIKLLKYNYFDLVRFLVPLDYPRRQPVNRIAALIRSTRKKNPNAQFSIIAHSYGSYILSRILERDDCFDIDFKTVILCGSIIDENFKWELFTHRYASAVNDFSDSDIWPLLASSSTWGYGASGRFGFGHTQIQDRRHTGLKHSDFLNAKFATDWWRPVLNAEPIDPPETVTSPPKRKIDWLLTHFKIKYVAALGIAVSALLLAPTPCARWIGYPLCYDRSVANVATQFLNYVDKNDYASAYAALAGPAKDVVRTPDGLQSETTKQRSLYTPQTRSLYSTAEQNRLFYHVTFRSNSSPDGSSPLFEYLRLYREGSRWGVVNYLVSPGEPPSLPR